ncbi:MAG: hypothetical protein Q7U75_10430, partial [Desulfobacterales bacterium]|nr:hypothetical protein [Desulfobacterales bacterium]
MTASAHPGLPVLAINLPRSVDRWERISASIDGSGLVLQRMVAVDGSTIPHAERLLLDAQRFRRYHGRT